MSTSATIDYEIAGLTLSSSNSSRRKKFPTTSSSSPTPYDIDANAHYHPPSLPTKPEKKERKHKKKKKRHIFVDEKDKMIGETLEEIDTKKSHSNRLSQPLSSPSPPPVDTDGVASKNATSGHKGKCDDDGGDDGLMSISPVAVPDVMTVTSSSSSPLAVGTPPNNSRQHKHPRSITIELGKTGVVGNVNEAEIEDLKKRYIAKREKRAKRHKKKTNHSEMSNSFISGIVVSSNSSSTSDPSNNSTTTPTHNNINNNISGTADDNNNVNSSDSDSDEDNEKPCKKGYFSKAFMSEFIDDDDESSSSDVDDNYCEKVPSDEEYDGCSSSDNSYDEAGICDLPPGWEPRFDYKNKRWYYVDHNTRTTHWRRPNTSVEAPLDPEIYPDPKATAELFLRSGPPKGKKSALKAYPDSSGSEQFLYVAAGTPRSTDMTRVAARNAKALESEGISTSTPRSARSLDSEVMSLSAYASQNQNDAAFTTNTTYSGCYDALYKDIVLGLRSTTQVAYESFEYDPTYGVNLTKDEQELRMFYTVYTRRVVRPSFDEDLFVKDYAPEAFDYMRRCLRVSRSAYMQSWSRAIVPPADPRTLSDIVLLSYDKRYVLRAVDHAAAKMIFKNFYTFVAHFRTNPSSAIGKIVGLYRIPNAYPGASALSGLKHMYFIAALNPIAHDYMIDEVYDIKPYKSLTSKNNFVSGENFKILVENRSSTVQYNSTKAKLLMGEKDRRRLMKQLDRDLHFLASMRLMGYCCIVAVHYTDLFTKPMPACYLSASSTSFAESFTIEDSTENDFLISPSLETDPSSVFNSPESPNIMTPEAFNIADRSNKSIDAAKLKVKRAASETPTGSPQLDGKAIIAVSPMEPVSLDTAVVKRFSRSSEVLISPRHLTATGSLKKPISPGVLSTSPAKFQASPSATAHSKLADTAFFSESSDESNSSESPKSHSPATVDIALKPPLPVPSHGSSSSPVVTIPTNATTTTTTPSPASPEEALKTISAFRSISPVPPMTQNTSHQKENSPGKNPPLSPIEPPLEQKPRIPKIPIANIVPPSSAPLAASSPLSSSFGSDHAHGCSSGSDKQPLRSPRSQKGSKKSGLPASLPKLNLIPMQRSPRSVKSPEPCLKKELKQHSFSGSLPGSQSGIIKTPRSHRLSPVIPVSKKCKQSHIHPPTTNSKAFCTKHIPHARM